MFPRFRRFAKTMAAAFFAALAAVLESADVRERFGAQSAEANVLGPDRLARFLDAERDQWADIVKRSGAKVD
jgi:tripartite-type tricarboxylate transporter receptor subunit TctC